VSIQPVALEHGPHQGTVALLFSVPVGVTTVPIEIDLPVSLNL